MSRLPTLLKAEKTTKKECTRAAEQRDEELQARQRDEAHSILSEENERQLRLVVPYKNV